MQVTANNAMLRLYSTDNRLTPEITLTLTDDRQSVMRQFDVIHDIVESGKLLSVEIKQYRQRRSLNANSYCWILCDKIAQVIRSTKEEVYREVIRRVGVFTDNLMILEAIDIYNDLHCKQGVGNQTEVIDGSNVEGYEIVRSYFGSSIYDTKQMARLIDEIVSQAKDLNIETLPPDELELMKSLWGG